MARIRSIKPAFWTDEKNLKLSDSCALFFIAFWNICDDEGKHTNTPLQISAELGGRWKQDKVKYFISCLVKSGQLSISLSSDYLQTTNWSHQLINRPFQPKVKSSSIQWVTCGDSVNTHCVFSEGSLPDKDRIRIVKNIKKSEDEVSASLPLADSKFDFDLILENYPKRDGDRNAAKARVWFNKNVKTEELFSQILNGVKNYKTHCDETNKTGTGFVKQLTTFFNSKTWLEYQEAQEVESKYEWIPSEMESINESH